MKMATKIVLVVIWLIAFMWIATTSLDMVSQPNTTENIVGAVILTLSVIASIKTHCLTKFKNLWKK